ncbi:MAG: hypothetical protein MRZ79_26630 [Bacteroidia bacterium]|nr:hypothetical protein [Bacteroidia bacterium]
MEEKKSNKQIDDQQINIGSSRIVFNNVGKTVLKRDQLDATFNDAKTILGAYGIELPENINEKYLKASDLNSIKNLMSDESLFMSLGGTFLGAILGIIVNISTNDPISFTKASILAIVTFLVIAVIFFSLAIRSKNRIKNEFEKVTKVKTTPNKMQNVHSG